MDAEDHDVVRILIRHQQESAIRVQRELARRFAQRGRVLRLRQLEQLRWTSNSAMLSCPRLEAYTALPAALITISAAPFACMKWAGSVLTVSKSWSAPFAAS